MFENEIICGDSNKILTDIEDGTIDCTIMDPPYLVRYRDRTDRSIRNDDNPEAVLPVFEQLFRVLKPHSYCVTFCGWNAIHEFSAAWADAGFKTVAHIIWRKNYASKKGFAQYRHESAYVLTKGRPRMPEFCISDVQDWTYTGNRAHPTEKAVEVIAPLVKAYSKPGDIVLDPFSGSGTTPVTAALNRRRFIGIELEEKYCVHARKRLAGVRRQ